MHTPLQELQRKTTSTEFLEWCWFFDLHAPNMFEPMYFYMAQIAFEVARKDMPRGWTGKLKDYLLKFKDPEPDQPETKESYLQRSKNFWLGLVKQPGQKAKKVSIDG